MGVSPSACETAAPPRRSPEDPLDATPHLEETDGRDAVGSLYRRAGRPAFRLAYALVGDRAVAEDLVQEAFVKVLARREQLVDPEALDGYGAGRLVLASFFGRPDSEGLVDANGNKELFGSRGPWYRPGRWELRGLRVRLAPSESRPLATVGARIEECERELGE